MQTYSIIAELEKGGTWLLSGNQTTTVEKYLPRDLLCISVPITHAERAYQLRLGASTVECMCSFGFATVMASVFYMSISLLLWSL